MPAPDPELAFVAHLRASFPDAGVGVELETGRPFVVVGLLPGGRTELRRRIDRVQLDLVAYGPDCRTLAAAVRAAVLGGFDAAGQRVRRVETDPPYPISDPLTYEPRFFVPVTASVYADPTA